MAVPERTSQLPDHAYALDRCNGPSHRGSVYDTQSVSPVWSRCRLRAAGRPTRAATSTTRQGRKWLQPIAQVAV